MHKKILLVGFLVAALPIVSSASIRPIVTLSLGADSADVHMTKTITMIAPFQNSYIGSKDHDGEVVGGIFLGGEMGFLENWAVQLGLSYFQSTLHPTGHVLQFADPAYDNFIYRYKIQSHRFLVESKLSHAFREIWHPYATVGLGNVTNRTHSYEETPIDSTDVPMTEAFGDHTTNSFTYAAGLGVDVDIEQHLRFGLGYRFVDLGKASLGVTPLQDSMTTISHSHLHTNEFLAQLTFVG